MAAGLGFKDFTTGEVLTAADVDGYLMQGVWVFASAAARDAAVTSPQEGNFAYLKDTNVTTYYTGSAWANLDTTGMTNPMTTTGDVIYSSSGSTPARLGIGSSGDVLTVAGGVPSWAAPATTGGQTLLSTTTLTGASVTTGTIAGTYKHLYLVIANVYLASQTGIDIRFNGDTGSNYVYSYVRNINVTVSGSNNAGTSIQIASRTASTNTLSKKSQIVVQLPRYTDTTPKGVFAQAYMHDDTNPANQDTAGTYVGTSAISTITLVPGANFTDGTLYVYGVN